VIQTQEVSDLVCHAAFKVESIRRCVQVRAEQNSGIQQYVGFQNLSREFNDPTEWVSAGRVEGIQDRPRKSTGIECVGDIEMRLIPSKPASVTVVGAPSENERRAVVTFAQDRKAERTTSTRLRVPVTFEP
jgi:hypothetical protein